MNDVLQQEGLELHVYGSIVHEAEPLLKQLIDKSRQEHILSTTPKDAATRFVDMKAIQNWFYKGRLAMMLVRSSDGDLAGMDWFATDEHAQVSDSHFTYAHRLYKGYLGRGLSTPFCEAAHDAAGHLLGEQKVWLTTEQTNVSAIATYEHVGYKTIGLDGTRLVMTKQLQLDMTTV